MRVIATILLCAIIVSGAAADPVYSQSHAPHGRELPSSVSETFEAGLGGVFTRDTTTSYTYSAQGRLLRSVEETLGTIYPIESRVTTSYTYDARGNVTSTEITDDFAADGIVEKTETTVYTYDARGRLESVVTLLIRNAFHGVSGTITVTQIIRNERGQVIEERTAWAFDLDGE